MQIFKFGHFCKKKNYPFSAHGADEAGIVARSSDTHISKFPTISSNKYRTKGHRALIFTLSKSSMMPATIEISRRSRVEDKAHFPEGPLSPSPLNEVQSPLFAVGR